MRHDSLNAEKLLTHLSNLFTAITNNLQQLSYISRAISISASSLLPSIEKINFLVTSWFANMSLAWRYNFLTTCKNLGILCQFPYSVLTIPSKQFTIYINHRSGNFDLQQFSNICNKANLTAKKNLFATIDIPPRHAKTQQYWENHHHNSAEKNLEGLFSFHA